MRKKLLLVFSLILVMVLAACGDKEGGSSEPTEVEKEQEITFMIPPWGEPSEEA